LLLVSNGEWVAVAAAVLLIGGTAGVLLTLPLWTGPRRRTFAVAVLSAHAGLVGTVGVIAAAAAARSWQLIGDDSTKHVAGLLQVSRFEGDGSMYALLVLALAFGTVLSVLALALSARFASSAEPGERIVACAALALEICVAGLAVARILGGSRSASALVVAAQLPLAMVAMVACWPPAEPSAVEAGARS
jgi:hypothetical protein